MFKKAVVTPAHPRRAKTRSSPRRGRSKRGGVNPLHPEEQWVPKNVEPLMGTRCPAACNG